MTAKPRLPEKTNPPPVLDTILDALTDLKFGSVEITVHEGRIVQIERREKLRLNLPLQNPA